MKLKRFIQQYRGSSFPTLIETENAQTYVLKMRGSGNGAISLVSEFIVSRIASQLGWPIPDAQWIQIPDNLPWTFGSDEFDDIVQKSFGWNLGISYIPDSFPITFDNQLLTDPVLVSALYTIDMFFMNMDRTNSANNLLRDIHNKIWIIDHGALALFQPGVKQTLGLFHNHILFEIPSISKKQYNTALHTPELFKTIIHQIPDAIINETHFSKETLLARIINRTVAMSEFVV